MSGMDTDQSCGTKECEEPAAYAMTFRGQNGHVHECVQHAAVLREVADVERVVSLPCPHPHGTVWKDQPRMLEA
jgi:hypothetical protein